MGTQHIIELNGQRYDALTGAIVTTKPVPASKKTKAKLPTTGRSMDGFARVPKQNLAPRQPQKSSTLMRTVVPKPKAPVHSHNHAVKSPIQPSPSASANSHKRSKQVPKSPLVSRFGNTQPISTHKPVVEQPTPQQAAHTSMLPSAPKATVHTERALASATSHKQPKAKKTKVHHRIARKLRVSPKLVSGVSFAAAFLLIGGFFTYQNIPGLSMRLAASRSGVQGSLPGYQPAGFSLSSSIAYKPGEVIINYKSNSDSRNFKVSQAASQWDSQSLLENYVAVNRRDYQTVQDKGKTVYLYEGSNATWVDGGIWYRIEGDSELNSDQLLNIAASL